MKRTFFLSVLLLTLLIPTFSQDKPESPEDFFGFKPGSDRNLFNYEQLIQYLDELDQASERMEMRKIGYSPMGKPMYIAFISTKENIANLDSLRTINRELALNPDLGKNEKESMVKNGKVFLLATLSMHSSEVGPAQSAPLTAYDLCTTKDPKKLEWLDNVVYMMVPNHNPDGMDLVIEYYWKTLGTKYEGSSQPGLYHKYVGHDNNRDFVTLSQEDTKVIADIYNTEWFPQVFVEKHQMGSTGTRYFVPPNHDPIAENVDEGIWNWTGIFGANLMKDMTREGLSGVSQHFLFDDYWPGSTETCIWKNVIGFLTECASAKIATPVFVESTELSVRGKGLSEYKKSINMPLPWPGGWWRLGDIVQYELVSVESILKTASEHRADILKFRNDLCIKQVETGKTTSPYFYIVPLKQHDESEVVSLVNLLKRHGVNIYQLKKDIISGNLKFSKGDIIIPLSQPYRSFIKEVMEKQEYPVRHYTPGGEIIKPYDITTWSLPLHNGLNAIEINAKIDGINEEVMDPVPSDFKLIKKEEKKAYAIFPVNRNESYRIAFLAVSEGIPVSRMVESKMIDNYKCGTGSFMIKVSDLDKNQEIQSQITVSPVYISEKPDTKPFKVPAIGLVESWFHDMDAGWTRFVMDSYHIPFTLLRPADLKTLDYSDYDVIIFPDENKSILLNGKYKSGDSYYMASYAPEYTKGMEKEGLRKLMEFINSGGKIVSWGQSTGLFEGVLTVNEGDDKEEFQLPFRDISDEMQKNGVYCPGSLIRMKLIENHPVTMGMPEECGIFYRGKPLFQTSVPNFDMDRRVIGIIPEKEILLSGYCENEEKLGNNPVLIWMSKGKGQLVLMGFNPQFRSSTHVTYKLLFNSILL